MPSVGAAAWKHEMLFANVCLIDGIVGSRTANGKCGVVLRPAGILFHAAAVACCCGQVTPAEGGACCAENGLQIIACNAVTRLPAFQKAHTLGLIAANLRPASNGVIFVSLIVAWLQAFGPSLSLRADGAAQGGNHELAPRAAKQPARTTALWTPRSFALLCRSLTSSHLTSELLLLRHSVNVRTLCSRNSHMMSLTIEL